MTVPHYRPTFTRKPWPNPWAHAISLGAYDPVTRNWWPGTVIVGGRLWVRCSVGCECLEDAVSKKSEWIHSPSRPNVDMLPVKRDTRVRVNRPTPTPSQPVNER